MARNISVMVLMLLLLSGGSVAAQAKTWSLNDCIEYALDQNIDIRKAGLSISRSELTAEQAANNRLPSVTGSARQNFSWSKGYDIPSDGWSGFSGNDNTSLALNGSLVLYNGQRISNRIRQATLDMEGSRYYDETVRESVSLSILDAFLQVLYADENVKNSRTQLEATTEELALAEERLNLSAISTSDYLQIKSQRATEKLTLANAVNQLTLSKVNLMQLMELPVTADFEVAAPDLAALLNQAEVPDAAVVYRQALEIKPQVRNTELTTEAARVDVAMARADLLPTLSLDAAVTSGYTGTLTGAPFGNQLFNKITPAAGVTLSIPIFQKKQAKTNISLAQISVAEAELTEINTKNQLRKAVEQACTDGAAARSEYDASLDQYQAQVESNQVATEKYQLGLLNSVDFLFEKTNLIKSESQLLQSKYALIFAWKVIDFYRGVPITL